MRAIQTAVVTPPPDAVILRDVAGSPRAQRHV